jgi:uncharacterized protein (TIGR03083 family)
MATVTPLPVATIPPLGRTEAELLARTEYRRFLDLLRGLRPEDWDRPTDCDRWTVKDVASHIVGETESFASLREFAHQWRLGPAAQREIGAPEFVDGVNEVQVRERRHLSGHQLAEQLAACMDKATRGRLSLPALVRAVPVPFGKPIGWRPVRYLVDQVITRDVWMHRIDIGRATGTAPLLTADHDGRLVADIVADWAGTHADPFLLELTGPAGRTYVRGEPALPTRIDAVEFVRILSGRAAGQGVLTHSLPL